MKVLREISATLFGLLTGLAGSGLAAVLALTAYRRQDSKWYAGAFAALMISGWAQPSSGAVSTTTTGGPDGRPAISALRWPARGHGRMKERIATARLVARATLDGLMEMRDEVPLGKTYRVRVPGQWRRMFNMDYGINHVQWLVEDADHPMEYLAAETLEIDGCAERFDRSVIVHADGSQCTMPPLNADGTRAAHYGYESCPSCDGAHWCLPAYEREGWVPHNSLMRAVLVRLSAMAAEAGLPTPQTTDDEATTCAHLHPGRAF